MAGEKKSKGGWPTSRCGNCVNCGVYQAACDLPKSGAKRRKKRDRAINDANRNNRCSSLESESSAKKPKITEVQKLTAPILGGRFRGEEKVDVSAPVPRQRPEDGHYTQGYNVPSFKKYADLVAKCESLNLNTTNAAIRDKSAAILKKMRLLLNESVREEVDYEEAIKDTSAIALAWSLNKPIGNRAFIPDINEREKMVNALYIYHLALEEREQIFFEWQEKFGDEGVDKYNQILGQLMQEVKAHIPLVNLFLKKFMKQMLCDDNLLEAFNYEDVAEWVKEAFHSNEEMSSFAAMMKTFGSTPQAQQKKSPVSGSDLMRQYFGCAPPRKDAPQQRVPAASSSTATCKPKNKRISRLQRLGSILREGLINASRVWYKSRSNQKGDAELRAVVAEVDDDLPDTAMRMARDAAAEMEKILFSQGGAKRLAATLRYFDDRPAIREAYKVCATLEDDGDGERYTSKEDKFNRTMRSALKGFLDIFGRKNRGRRSAEDQNAFDAVLAALNGGDIKEQKLGRALSRSLGISYRQMKRSQKIRKNLEDQDSKKWVRSDKVEYPWAVNTEAKKIIADVLHTDLFSRVDNSDKREFVVHGGVTDSGQAIYDIHPARHLTMSHTEIFDTLTGRNRADPANPKEPNPSWKAVQRATATPNRPNGIKGSVKLLRQCQCPCLQNMHVNVCSCPFCTRFEENLRLYHKARKEWHRQADAKRRGDIIEEQRSQGKGDADIKQYLVDHECDIYCSCSNFACRAQEYRSFSSSVTNCLDYLLCDEERVPEMDLCRLDRNYNPTPHFDEFKSHREQCSYSRCLGASGCGWNKKLCALPEQMLVETDEDTGEESTF